MFVATIHFTVFPSLVEKNTKIRKGTRSLSTLSHESEGSYSLHKSPPLDGVLSVRYFSVHVLRPESYVFSACYRVDFVCCLFNDDANEFEIKRK